MENILLVANFDSDVGFAWWLIEAYWAEIAWAHGSGKRVFLAYPSISKIPEVIDKAPIECVHLDVADESPAGIEKLTRFIEENQIGRVYWTDGPLMGRCYERMRRAGVDRIVIHTHRAALPTNQTPIRSLAKKIVHGWGAYSADHYVVVSDFVRRTIESNTQVPQRKMISVGSGIDLGRLDGHLETDLELPKAEIRVAMLGRIDPGKGFDFAIEVARGLRDRELQNRESERGGSPVRIRIVHIGTGTQRDDFDHKIHAEGLGDWLTLLGYQEQVGALLRQCQIGFHPSEGEVGYSLAILEMLSQKLPMVLPEVESVTGGLEGSDCWTGYAENNVEQAVEGIVSLASDRRRRQKMGEIGRSLVARKFDFHLSLSKFRERVIPLLA